MSKIDARILVAEDDPQMQIAIQASLSRSGYDVVVVGDGQAALEYLDSDSADLLITDQRMPNMTGLELLASVQKREGALPVIMITAHGTITQAVEAMQLGAADFITKPFSVDDLVRVVERVLSPDVRAFRGRSQKKRSARPIVTNDALMIRILEVCEAVARSDATVLIQGESGTGKELVARLIHTASPRAQQPFVAVNCAALPQTLLESELFGHEKGAFTGAQNRKLGKFELAHGGTILLDEISEMDLVLQAKLLRVLQEREVDRVGGRDPVSIDVRVLATTNRNLEEAVAKGAFRSDLYYRLNVIPITLPPLRDRSGDIALLARHFMHQALGERAPSLSVEVIRALESYRWPGNVRELQNAVERAAILAGGATPQEADFLLSGRSEDIVRLPRAPSLAEQIVVTREDTGMSIRSGVTVHEMEKALIMETLKSTNQNRTEAAKLLGISIRTLRNKLHEYRVQDGGSAAEMMDDGAGE